MKKHVLKYLSTYSIIQNSPKDSKMLSDYIIDKKERTKLLQFFKVRKSNFGILARTYITYKRDNKPFVRNVIKVFFTKETLDRDIKFLENYPYYNDRIRNNELTQIAMLKVLKQKAFGDENDNNNSNRNS